MRETYRLTNETLNVLADKVIAIASEMDVSDKHLYAVLAGTETDPFAKFRRLYAAAVRAGADVSPWDASLSAIKARHSIASPERTQMQCLVEKITLDADTTAKLVDALHDGEIDPQEMTAIRKAIAKERDSLDVLEIYLGPGAENGHIPTIDVRKIAKAAVAKRRA